MTLFFIPESPRWLILKRNKVQEAREILNVSDAGEAERVVVAILKSQHKSTTGSFRDLFKPLYKTPVRLAVLFALFNQLSGINAIIYYAPRVFEMAGLGKESALLSSAGIGPTSYPTGAVAQRQIWSKVSHVRRYPGRHRGAGTGGECFF